MAIRFIALSVLAPLVAACASNCRNVAERPDSPIIEAAEAAPARTAAAARSARSEPAAPPPFLAELRERARALAAQPPSPPREMELPKELSALSYDEYRKIRFRPDQSLWRGQPGRFELQFFHPGFYYKQPVGMHVIQDGKAQPLPFTTDWFSYEGLPKPPPPTGLDFVGFRVHTPLNKPEYRDEVLVFHGASYFRPLGKGNVYGLSARGLAIDMGEPHPEEFPTFTQFYVARPGENDSFMWILALLESRRATGAYAFRLEPGDVTTIEVTASIFLREVAGVGLAPLTSMYLFGEDAPNRFGDFRPEVHDSDGLSMSSSTGEQLFRPLRNPPKTVVTSFRLDSPRGFGLVQRDRDFDHFQDLEARYQDRPSLWVEPLSGFGKGSVRLLEIATNQETDDNIAIAWMPDADTLQSRTIDVSYRLHVGSGVDLNTAAAHVSATRIGRTEQGARFLVDFRGRNLADVRDAEVVVSTVGGRVIERHVEQNPHAEALRASFEVAPEPGVKDIELRAFLRTPNDVLTETWSYLWQPN